MLSFKESPDYEAAKGGGTTGNSNTYTVMVEATDETRRVASKTVMVKVTNVDEAGTVTLSARRPQTDTAFTAEISDPDVSDPDDGVTDESGSGPRPVQREAPTGTLTTMPRRIPTRRRTPTVAPTCGQRSPTRTTRARASRR